MPSYPSRFAVAGGYCGHSQESCGKKFETVSIRANTPPPSNTDQKRFNMFLSRIRGQLLMQSDNYVTVVTH